MRERLQVFAILLLLAAMIAGRQAWAGETVAQQIRALTGAKTRIVWIRGINAKAHQFGSGMTGPAKIWTIMALDTEEGQERPLVAQPGSYSFPIFTPSGKRVIFTDWPGKVIYITDFSGGAPRKLVDGFGVGTAEDPPGTEWVYFFNGKFDGPNCKPLVRMKIDKPGPPEVVWDKTGVNDKVEIARDGKYVGGGIPWPTQGYAALPNGELVHTGDGCQGGLAPDGSLRNMHMRGDHGGIIISEKDGSNPRFIALVSGHPGAFPSWAPRWSMYDVHFLSWGGSYPASVSSQGEIFLAKLNADLTAVEKQIQVTTSPQCDTQSCVYIEAAGNKAAEAGKQAGAAAKP